VAEEDGARPGLAAPHETLDSRRAGRIGYWADRSGDGRPLLLVHSVNAAPSAFEMQPLFAHYRGRRPVFAIDLPGFGTSERGDRPYTPELYAAAIEDVLAERVPGPADVVALSLGAELAAAAALAQPERFASLVLISPTGLGARPLPGPDSGRGLGRILRAPVLSDALFALLTTRPSIRYFLGKGFHGTPPAALLEAAHHTAHQPGAKFAPLTFLSFALFTPDARQRLYERVDAPVLALYDQDPNVSFEQLPELVRARPRWRAERIAPTRGLPHWEALEATTAAMDRFWAEVHAEAPAPAQGPEGPH